MSTRDLSLDEIYSLAKNVMLANGCDTANAEALADIICRAERDGSHSHGLFRVPGYVKALRSGKVDGKAKPLSCDSAYVAIFSCFINSHIEIF